MKTQLLKYLLAICFLCGWCRLASAQEYYDGTNTPRQYYYNNLESATAGSPTTFLPAAGSTRNSSATTIDLTSSSSLNSSKSLTSQALSSIGYLQWNFMSSSGSAAALNLGAQTYEWEFDYKNVTGATTSDVDGVTAAASSSSTTDFWRYYLIANTYTTPSSYNYTTGLYVTQEGGNLILRLKYGTANNQSTQYASVSMPNSSGTTYQIRIVKSIIGYYNIYILNRTTLATTSSLNINVGTSVSGVNLNTYNFSYLECSTSAGNRFQWDNFNFYQQKVDYVPITSAANGITTSIYPGEANVIPYGVNANIRGDIIFGTLVFNSSTNGQALFTGGALWKTTNSVVSISSGTSLVTGVAINSSNTSQMTLPSSEYYYNPGNTDGTTANVINYFLVVQTRNPYYTGYPTSISYSVSTAAADNYQAFYTSGHFPYGGGGTTGGTIGVGSYFDWVGGTSTSWKLAANWSPATVPGSSDIARIGTNLAFTNQPTFDVVGGGSVGSIQIGTLNAPYNFGFLATTLTVSTPLTVNGNFTVSSNFPFSSTNTLTIAGTSSLGITGNIVFGDGTTPANFSTAGTYNFNYTNTGTLTATGSLNLTPITSGGNVFSPAFTQSAGIVHITGINTTNPAGTTSAVKVTGGTLQLAGVTPLSGLSSTGTNNISFNNTGATVEYDGTAQTVYNSTAANISGGAGIQYYNLTLSGSGTKTVPAGYLTVNNNFVLSPTSAMTVDLATNNTVTNVANFSSNSLSTITQGSGQNFTTYGTAVNGGVINIIGNSSLAFQGTAGLINNGTINGLAGYTNQQNILADNGPTVNNGTINWYGLTTGAYVSTIRTLALTNTGTINQQSGYLGVIVSSGLITNTSGSINQAGTGSITGTAGLTNNALITQSNGTIAISGTLLTNNSTITKTGGTLTCAAGFTNGSGGTFTGATTAGSTTTVTAGAFSNTGTFTCNAETVTFDGNYSNNAGGTFTAGSGTVYYNGTVAQSLVDNSTAGTTFNNVSFSGNNASNAKTMSGSKGFAVSSTGYLAMVGTTTTLAAGGVLTLKSDTLGAANVGQISTGSSITGNVTVQRFVQGSGVYNGGGTWRARNYRNLSSPVNDGIANGAYVCSLNYLGERTIITGCTSTYGTTTGNPSLYLYDEHYLASDATFTSGNFVAITDITATTPSASLSLSHAGTASTGKIYAGGGVMIYFRGDKVTHIAGAATKTKFPYVGVESVTFNATGALNQGTIPTTVYNNVNVSLLYSTSANDTLSRGFNLVGNPYASTIDWNTFGTANKITATYVNPTIYITDPTLAKTYSTYNAFTAKATNGGSNLIPSGQGFFVQSNNHASSLTFYEGAKVNQQVTGSTLLLSVNKSDVKQNDYASYLRVQLTNAADTALHTDMVVGFKATSTTNYNHIEDDLYFPASNGAVGLYTPTADGVKTVVRWLPLPKSTAAQVVKLTVNAKATGLYSLQKTDLKAVPAIYDIWLMDAFKKDSLDLRRYPAYNFNVDLTDTTTFGNNRFTLVIRENPELAYRLLSFNAIKANSGTVDVNWKTENEQDYTTFTVERSIDNGKTFTDLNTIQSSDAGIYKLNDPNPVVGTDIYRLKQVDYNNDITYSALASITITGVINPKLQNILSVYPNPAAGVINLTITPQYQAPALYQIKVMSMSGHVLRNISVNNTFWQNDISDLKPGTYVIQVLNNKGLDEIGKTKFIKL